MDGHLPAGALEPVAGVAQQGRGGRADLFTRLGEFEEFALTQPSRTKYLLLVFGYLRRLLELHLEFVDDVERELEG